MPFIKNIIHLWPMHATGLQGVCHQYIILVIKDLTCWINVYNGVQHQVLMTNALCIWSSHSILWEPCTAQRSSSGSPNKISRMYSTFALDHFAATYTLYTTIYKLWNADWSCYATLHHVQLSLAVQYAGHLFITSVPRTWDDCTVSTISEQEARKHTQYSHQATGWMSQGWMPDRGKSCCSYSCCPDWLWGSPTPIFKGYWGAPTQQVKQPGHVFYRSPPSSAKVKDVGSILLLLLHYFMVRRGTTVPLL